MIIKCKMCGGDLEFQEGMSVCECEFCGTAQTIPQVDNEKKLNLFNRANRLRMASEFDKAASVYESIVAEFPEEAEAYWGLCLCAYGIEYVDDPATGRKMPTCHRTRQTSIMDDGNFDMACEYADAVAKKIYREEAKEIDRLQRDILRIVAGEAPYDVFICYKETDSNGGRTQDSVLAQDIYDALTAKGLKVFFARITLEDKLGQQYEPYIFAALHSARVMLAIGTDYEYFDAVWVKNEWSRFLDMMKTDRQKTLIPCYKGIDAYDIPKEFRNLQAQDMGKLGWLQDLTRGVVKLCGKDQPQTVQQTIVQQVQAGGNAAALLKRGQIYLQDGDFAQASSYFDRVLDEDPENAQAYEGKFLCQMRVTTLDEAMQFLIVPDSYKDLERAVRFAKGEDKRRIGGFEQAADRKYYLTQLVKGVEQYARAREGAEYEAGCNALYREGTAEALDKMIDLYAKAIAKKLNPKVFSPSNLVVIRQQRGLIRELEKDYQLRNAASLAKATVMPESAARYRLDELVSKGAIEQHKTSAGTYYCALQAGAKRATLDRYNAAMQKMEYAGHHRQETAAAEAAQLFEQLGNYRDAAEKARECEEMRLQLKAEAKIAREKKYSQAMDALNRGDYARAMRLFEELGDYQDSTDRAAECHRVMDEQLYRQAKKLMENKKWSDAIKAFDTLKSYKDSREMVGECRRLLEEEEKERKRLQEEAEKEKQRQYELAMQALAKAKVRKKRNILLFVLLTVIVAVAVLVVTKVIVPANHYKTAEELFAQGKQLEALAYYRRVGEYKYKDSLARQREILSAYNGRIAVGNGPYTGGGHTVAVKDDGTVVATGYNNKGQCDVQGWTDIVAVAAGDHHTVGLKKDGTVVAVGDNHSGQCDVQNWRNIVAVYAGHDQTYGVKLDGTVVATGNNSQGQCDVQKWKNIVDIGVSSMKCYSLGADGGVNGIGYQTAITKNWKAVYGKIVDIDASATDVIGLTENGWVIGSELGTGVVSVHIEGINELALRADGTVVYNGMGDYRSNNPNQWTDVLAIALGEDYVVCMKTDGSVVAFGANNKGQCNVAGWNLGTTPLKVDESLAQAVAESEAVLPEKQLSQDTYGAYGQGFAGPVWVEVSFDEEGRIGYFTIGDEKFCETDGFGRKVQWPDFMDQFYGIQPPLSLADIDAVSGATTSSRAVVEGINKAYEQWLQATGKTVETVKGSAKGLIGPVNVEVAFDEHGKILFLIVDASQETKAFGSQVEKSSFRDQFIGMKAPVDMAQVDAVSGATYSSKAVVEGINNAYLLWLQANGKAAETVPAQEVAAQLDAVPAKSWSASEEGFSGPVKVDVVFDAEGKIKSLSVAAEHETPGLGTNVLESSFRDQFIGMKAPVNMADIDVASHATVSSTAAVNAINKAYDLYLQSK